MNLIQVILAEGKGIGILMRSSIPFGNRGFFLADVMRLKVNGNEYLTEKSILTHLLQELEIVPERVAVEVNLRVIKREDFARCELYDGDDVEIVYFVGGGS